MRKRMARSAVRKKADKAATKQIHVGIQQLKRKDEVVGTSC